MNFLKDEGLFFVPLGGSEQFGVNLNVYIADGKMLVIDCGIGFADEHFPGIDILLPDPIFLEENKDKISGLVVTHAHEDHVGAVAHLWSRLKCPIYTTPFTAVVLKRKLDEAGVKGAKVEIVNFEEPKTLGPFHLDFLPVAHSIPDACSVLVQAGGVKALHSGDWNLDPAPVIGAKTEKERFSKIGPVDAYVGDSTNAGVPGRAGSESEIADGLFEEFKKVEGRIFVTTFASNVGRLASIVRAAEKAGRRVGVVGRSMHRMIAAAHECGYMHDLPDFIPEGDLKNVADRNLVVMCTGSQGEGRAALARIAAGSHPAISAQKGDTVIFSARTIPGNEIGINAIKNNLIAAGIHIVSPSDSKHKIHVSGHPCRDEILDMWGWIKPAAVIPVHGERTQLEAHAALAAEAQIKNCIVPSNGSVIKLGPGAPEVVDHVETGMLAVDQKRIITTEHRSISARRTLQYSGFAHVAVALDEKGRIMGDLQLETFGLVDETDDEEMVIEDRLYNQLYDILEGMSRKDRLSDDHVEEKLRLATRRSCNKHFGMKPKTTVHVIRV